MKEKYIDIMDRAFRAYSTEQVEQYFNRVKTEGLTEHGFPRLTADLGILIAHGRHTELLPLFMEMMDFCCDTMYQVKAANDFSVKEIVFCLMEIEKAGLAPAERCAQWREGLSKIVPRSTYNSTAGSPLARTTNWTVFNLASEHMRGYIGLTDPSGWNALMIPTVMHCFQDEGMFYESKGALVYDAVPRLQFAVMLHFGYRGDFWKWLDALLRRAGLMTLKMQSVTGEMPFGGRSAQFLYTEALQAAVCEFEANRYKAAGDLELAGQFKRAAQRSVDSINEWMDRCENKKHDRNKFDWDSMYGCEPYAYFDKYMITLASFIYVAYLFADDEIEETTCPAETGGYTLTPPAKFHKFFANCGGYDIGLDTKADHHYDVTGINRIHKAGAPGTVGLSLGFPHHSSYKTFTDNEFALGLGAGHVVDGEVHYHFGTEWFCSGVEVAEEGLERVAFSATFESETDPNTITESYVMTADGIDCTVKGDKLAYAIPAFDFDGKDHPEITVGEHELTVKYENSVYRVTTNGTLTDTGMIFKNRNGHYRYIRADGEGELTVHFEITNA